MQVRFGVGIWELGTPGSVSHTQSCVGQVCAHDLALRELFVRAASFFGGPSRSLTRGLVKILAKYLQRLCSWCKEGRVGVGRKWRGE